jgi:hypothetical protein
MEFPGAKPKVGNPALAPELGETVSATVDELERVIQLAELQRDPLRHALKAMAQLLRAIYRLFVDGTRTIAAQLEAVQRAQPQITDVHIARLSDNFVAALNPTVAKAVRHLDLKMMLGFAAYSVFMVGAFGLIGYNYGYNAGYDAVASRHISVRLSGKIVPDLSDTAADRWYSLMRFNDIAEVWSHCQAVANPDACAFTMFYRQPTVQQPPAPPEQPAQQLRKAR